MGTRQLGRGNSMDSVLIVQGDCALADVWRRHIARMRFDVHVAHSAADAIDLVAETPFSLVVLDLGLPGGNALTVSDYAGYRRPETRIVFVTASRFFSDGSLFNFSRNACAVLPSATPPADLAVLVDHYGKSDRQLPVTHPKMGQM